MKKTICVLLLAVLCLLSVPGISGDERLECSGKKYNLEITDVDLFEHTSAFTGEVFRALEVTATTGRKEQVNAIEFKYDFEEEKAEKRGKFVEDAPVALVKMDGFCTELTSITETELVIVLVDGVQLAAKGTDYDDYVGWQNVYGGDYGVVFPVELTKEGSETLHTIEVYYLVDGYVVSETAEITVNLINTHGYKDEAALRIKDIECEGAECYMVGNKIYVEHPKGTVGTKELKLTFAKADGSVFKEIGWVQETESKGGVGAISLGKETRLKDSYAVFALDQNATQEQSTDILIRVETEKCWYISEKLSVVQRFDVEPKELIGVRFAEKVIQVAVGEEVKPQIVEVENGETVRDGLWYKVTLLPEGDNGVAYAEGDTLLGVRCGEGVLRAKVLTSDGKVLETGSVRVVVTEGKSESYAVSCRKLNVRAGAGTGFPVVAQVMRGEVLSVVSVQDGWARLSDGSYVCAKYLSKI